MPGTDWRFCARNKSGGLCQERFAGSVPDSSGEDERCPDGARNKELIPDTTKRNTKIRKVQGPWMQPRSLSFYIQGCPYFIAKSQTLLKGFSRIQ